MNTVHNDYFINGQTLIIYSFLWGKQIAVFLIQLGHDIDAEIETNANLTGTSLRCQTTIAPRNHNSEFRVCTKQKKPSKILG